MVKRKTKDLQVDVVSDCPCCGYESLEWQNFLEFFDAHLPEFGEPVPITVRFVGGNTRRVRDTADRLLRDVQTALAARGAIRVVGDAFEAAGFFTSACANNH